MDLKTLIKYYQANSSQMMWLLGAGTSRSANMPTATDLVWDLKLKHYCSEENVDIKTHDLSNYSIQNNIQSYMDSRGYPKLWSLEEYSFYFELVFGNDYQLQQKYLKNQLDNKKISLCIGHRVLAALLGTGHAKVAFTTNFDEVIETAYAQVMGKNLTTFHLEGSYAVLEALNQEDYPIYAKIHGDFRYQNVKNLAADLLHNDEKIRSSFIAGATRFGLVVTGYSGRDKNVMQMLNDAINQNNAFPQGLYWTVLERKHILPEVSQLIERAKKKGIRSEIVETGTFDTFLLSLWKQIPDINKGVKEKVNINRPINTTIQLKGKGSKFPMIRTNGLPIEKVPTKCAVIKIDKSLSVDKFHEILHKKKPKGVFIIADSLYAWGFENEIKHLFEDFESVEVFGFEFENPIQKIKENTIFLSFFERALCNCLIDSKPLSMIRIRNRFVLIPHKDELSNLIFQPVTNALSKPNFKIKMGRQLTSDTFWLEALEVKLESKGEGLWLMLRPTIYISPNENRPQYLEQIKKSVRFRYNPIAHKLLNAWIKILFGNIEKGSIAQVNAFSESEYPIQFQINNRTSFSKS